MAEKVKIYDQPDKKKGIPPLVWILPLLLIVALLIYYFTRDRNRGTQTGRAAADQVSPFIPEPVAERNPGIGSAQIRGAA